MKMHIKAVSILLYPRDWGKWESKSTSGWRVLFNPRCHPGWVWNPLGSSAHLCTWAGSVCRGSGWGRGHLSLLPDQTQRAQGPRIPLPCLSPTHSNRSQWKACPSSSCFGYLCQWWEKQYGWQDWRTECVTLLKECKLLQKTWENNLAIWH